MAGGEVGEGVGGKAASRDSLSGQGNIDFLPRKSSMHTDTDKPGEIKQHVPALKVSLHSHEYFTGINDKRHLKVSRGVEKVIFKCFPQLIPCIFLQSKADSSITGQ